MEQWQRDAKKAVAHDNSSNVKLRQTLVRCGAYLHCALVLLNLQVCSILYSVIPVLLMFERALSRQLKRVYVSCVSVLRLGSVAVTAEASSRAGLR
jgi:hypothetical protein